MDSDADPVFSAVSAVSLLACALQGAAAYLMTRRFGGNSSMTDRWVLTWLFYDVIVHVTLEGPFVLMSLRGSVEASEGPVAQLWQEYGKADRRWLSSDPNIVSVEILTVVLCSALGLALIHAVVHDKHYRHFLQISLSVCELYGGWMTFAPEWLQGCPSLNQASSWLHLWVYLVFFNGIWVLVPALLLLQSWAALRGLHRGKTRAD
uniref:EBP like n=1 Tax=Neogobius melanostomus TaxID=47308 RepID=A0A8C6UWK1_9GOBI